MSDPILCHECGHDIDNHDLGECYDCSGMLPCDRTPSSIARAYGEERFHEGWDACELQWAVRHSE